MRNRRLSFPIAVLVIAAIVAVIASSSGAKKTTQPPVAAGSALSLRQTSVGKTLTDANGRTLYLFAADKPNLSTLSAAGRAVWPPFTSAVVPKATGGAQASRIGATTTAGGVTQVTYNGHPLYYFVRDQKPGQLLGQGLNEFGARWYVLSGAGAAITATPKATAAVSSSPAGSGGGGYGY